MPRCPVPRCPRGGSRRGPGWAGGRRPGRAVVGQSAGPELRVGRVRAQRHQRVGQRPRRRAQPPRAVPRGTRRGPPRPRSGRQRACAAHTSPVAGRSARVAHARAPAHRAAPAHRRCRRDGLRGGEGAVGVADERGACRAGRAGRRGTQRSPPRRCAREPGRPPAEVRGRVVQVQHRRGAVLVGRESAACPCRARACSSADGGRVQPAAGAGQQHREVAGAWPGRPTPPGPPAPAPGCRTRA